MRAIELKRYGGPGVLVPSGVREPKPGRGEVVVVKVILAGINYAEILSRKGLYGWAPRLHNALDMECSGIIRE